MSTQNMGTQEWERLERERAAVGSAPVRQDPDLVAVMLTRDQAWELRREDQRHWLVVACYEALRSEQGED